MLRDLEAMCPFNYVCIRGYFYTMYVAMFMYTCTVCINCVLTWLKAVDTIGNCQRPVFSLVVSQHMHKIRNLWKFELNRSPTFQDNNERKNTHVTRSCVRLDSWFWDLKLRSRNQIRRKLFLSRKVLHFRGSRFSQCFILATYPHYSLPNKVFC